MTTPLHALGARWRIYIYIQICIQFNTTSQDPSQDFARVSEPSLESTKTLVFLHRYGISSIKPSKIPPPARKSCSEHASKLLCLRKGCSGSASELPGARKGCSGNASEPPEGRKGCSGSASELPVGRKGCSSSASELPRAQNYVSQAVEASQRSNARSKTTSKRLHARS